MNRVLIVEDDRYMNETLCELLEEEGFKVDNSFAGSDAIKKVEKPYNLLILDYNLMSGKTGMDVYDIAKKNNPDVKAIMISAYGNNKIREKALDNGINVYLDKPFMIDDLINAAKSLVRDKSGPKQNISIN